MSEEQNNLHSNPTEEVSSEENSAQHEQAAEETPQAHEAEHTAQDTDEPERNEAVTQHAEPRPEDFDWDSYEKGYDQTYTREEQAQLEELYENSLSDIEEREVLDGTVVGITDRDVVVNIGYKSDGLVPLSEFKYNPDLKPGDTVELLVEKKEDCHVQIRLSHRKAKSERAWEKILDAYHNDKTLEGHIKDRTKGGMVVDVLGMDTFMPGSQIDIRPIKDYDAYVGQTMDVKVVKLNEAFRNIVVSHKAIIESDLEQQKTEILSKLEKGQVLEGMVKNLTSFGVFVDLGGVDGLIHITDVSWGRINHPEEVLELGQKLNVVVLDYDEEKKRISLGLKQLTAHPWDNLSQDIQEGTKLKGKVVNIEDYGAFVEVSPGVEGLVHVSEMSWSSHLKSPQEYVQLGQEVETVVLNIDREERKLALGMKQLTEDPWERVQEKYPVGSKHTGRVRSLTNFGLFCELEEGIDGLLHVSDLSWTRKINHPAEFTQVGEHIDVVVLDIDKDNRRLSLGHKQLEEDPWDTFESIFLEGSVHEGVVLSVDDKGAVIQMPYGIEAFAPAKHIQKKDKSKLRQDETAQLKVLEFDKSNRKVIVSHTQIWRDEDRASRAKEDEEKRKSEAETQKTMKKMRQSSDKGGTLADELDILKEIKSKLETTEKERQQEAMAEMEARNKGKDDQEASEEDQEPSSEASDDRTSKDASSEDSQSDAGKEEDSRDPAS